MILNNNKNQKKRKIKSWPIISYTPVSHVNQKINKNIGFENVVGEWEFGSKKKYINNTDFQEKVTHYSCLW